MVVIWSKDAKLDLKNYIFHSKLYAKDKLENKIINKTLIENRVPTIFYIIADTLFL